MRIGEQRPRVKFENGSVAYTDGEDAALLGADIGIDPFEWERTCLNAWCSRDEGDRPSYITCGLSVPRQNGKNAVLEVFEVYMIAVCGYHVLHTAHRVKTAKKSFQRLVRYFKDDAHPELKELVEKIRYTNGEEAIYLKNGGSIEFSARSNAGGRGFDDIQIVVFDEAQELTDPQLSAIMYTLAASSTGDRQMIFTGTPPDATCPGNVFRRTRRGAMAGTAGRTCWYEWGVEELPARDASFEDVLDDVYESNPSMGLMLDIDFTRAEFDKATVEGFAVERLGWWSPDAGADTAIPRKLWEDSAIKKIGDGYRAKTAFGLKFSADGSRYCLAGCKLDSNGNAAVEIVEVGGTGIGTRKLAEALHERRSKASCVVVDGLSGAPAFCENMSDLRAPRGYVLRPSAGDVISAAGLVVDGLRDGTLKHVSNGGAQAELDDSATTSTRRLIGTRGGWGFGSADGHDSTAIEAASLALFGVRNSKRNPRRKQRTL